MARKLPIPNGRLDGALDANGMRIVNLADPLSDDDAATKGFVRKNAVNAGVRSIGGKSGDLTLEDIGAQPALPFDVQWQAYGITAARALCDENGEFLTAAYARKSEVAAFVGLLEVTPGVYELRMGLDKLTFQDLWRLHSSCGIVKLVHNSWEYDLTRLTPTYASFDLVTSFGPDWREGQKPRISSVRMLAAGDVLQVFEAKELALKSDIPPAPSNAKVTIAQGGVEKGSFTLNQAEGASINLPAPSDAKVTITQGGVEKGSFTLNQAGGASINLEAGGGGGGGGSGHKVTVRNNYEYGSEPIGEVVVDGVHLVSTGSGLAVKMLDSWISTYATKYLNVDELVMDGAKLVCPHANGNSPYAVKVDGVPFTGNRGTVLSKDMVVDLYSYYCIAADTPVTLADGTTKPLRDIGYDDELMVWDFDTGTRSSAKPAWVQQVKTARYYWRSVFENGKVFRTVGPHGHRVYNLTKKDFLYIDECEGDEVLMQDLTVSRLVRNERVDEPIEYSNIITKRHINFFADGILATCVLNRIYPVDGMKFMKEARALRKFEDYGGCYLTREWFDDCRYSEQPGEVNYLNDYAVRTHKGIAKSRI